ncbi:hypothetical protein B0H66DRAFT_608471 [Apodospora peruviana]|uniref:Uncharacterized protein n=1 Tax=Apodospora peruviana TaxID=516989 RepID=A0AAE0HT85_9PEZI|nr:hypothetical protein B0H66DRAFT_608471 [Apodospora peruviana]
MRLRISTCLAIVGMAIAQTLKDECPKDEIACLDIINSSQCIEQVILENRPPLTKDNLLKCVEYEGVASNLPGAAKYCRCPGCHSEPINAAIKQMFPPPCN